MNTGPKREIADTNVSVIFFCKERFTCEGKEMVIFDQILQRFERKIKI